MSEKRVPLDEIASRLRSFFEDDPRRAVAVYLFGSVARRSAGPASDVDLAVLYALAPPARLDAPPLEWEGEIERHLGRRVQLVVLNGAPVDLVHRVLRDGVILLDRDPARRIRFEVRARNEYFDLLPILQRYRKTGTG